MDTRRNGSGFTLVEMLVVLAVITILASITVPAVMRAQSVARQTSCANNLSQMGKGLYQYAHNWDRYFPANRPPPISTWSLPFERGYDDLSPLYFERYIPDINAYNCPSTRVRCGTLPDKTEWWKELRYKRTGKTVDAPPEIPDPPPKLAYEYCGEYNPSLQYTRTNTHKAWLMHDEDGRNENTEAVQRQYDLVGLQLNKDSNHRTRGGNMLFVDGRVEWITRMPWAERVMDGIKEWARVTGWRLPDGRLETEE